MTHAQRENSDSNQYFERTNTERGRPLDESMVIEHLETDFCGDEDRKRIVGITNGIFIGAILWLLLLTVVLIVV